MGYKHVSDGSLKLNQYAKEHLQELENWRDSSSNLEDAFEIVEISAENPTEDCWLNVSSWSWSNYYEDEVIAVLKEIAPFIEEGQSIDFRGEDDEHWRFLKVSDGWEEQNGVIEYKKGNLI